VYLPSVIVILGNMAPALLDFVLKLLAFVLMALGIVALGGELYIHAERLGWAVAALALAFLLAVALSLWTAPWGEGGRDLRFGLAQVLPIWFLLTPVLYPMSAMPASWHVWVRLNPMTSLVETFKWSVFGVGAHDSRAFAISAAAVVSLSIIGLTYYARSEALTQDAR
jgi:lipopolysaccharide transport system permease protein